MIKQNLKKSQSELITTVLLVLISIAAVVLVSTFVINMVKNNLKNTDCVHTTGQVNIDSEKTYLSNPETGNSTLYIGVERGEKEFNITKLGVIYGTSFSTSKKFILAGNSDDAVNYIQPDGVPSSTIVFPDSSELKVYSITLAEDEEVNLAAVEVFINNGVSCGKLDEVKVSTRA